MHIRLLLLLAAVVITLAALNGCYTFIDDDGKVTPWTSHDQQLLDKSLSDIHEMHKDFDYIIWGINIEED